MLMSARTVEEARLTARRPDREMMISSLKRSGRVYEPAGAPEMGHFADQVKWCATDSPVRSGSSNSNPFADRLEALANVL